MEWTPERRAAQGERMRARHAERVAAGRPGFAYGHRNSPEVRAKMSEAQRTSYATTDRQRTVLSLEHEAKLRAAQAAWWAATPIENEKHHNWKGDRAGYTAIHDWVKRRWGPRRHVCEWCGRETLWTDIANLDHQYSRDLADYRELCRSCHRRWDKDHGLETKGGQKARLAIR